MIIFYYLRTAKLRYLILVLHVNWPNKDKWETPLSGLLLGWHLSSLENKIIIKKSIFGLLESFCFRCVVNSLHIFIYLLWEQCIWSLQKILLQFLINSRRIWKVSIKNVVRNKKIRERPAVNCYTILLSAH